MPNKRLTKAKNTVTVSEHRYRQLLDYEFWCKGAQWEYDNYGQVLLYTGKDRDGKDLECEDAE